jgi:hypothetical protein
MALLVPTIAGAQPGVWQTEEEFLSQAGPEWSAVAPGVWERETSDDHFVRVGFGIESFLWALDQARDRLDRLTTRSASSPDGRQLERRIDKARQVVEFLEQTLEDASAGNDDLGSLKPKVSDDGPVCNGHYTLDISLTCGYDQASVTSRAEWGEFGPLAPYEKVLHTYAESTWYEREIGRTFTFSQEDTTGPFSFACCALSTSTASGSPYNSDFYGSAYVTVSNGCSAYRFLQHSGSC